MPSTLRQSFVTTRAGILGLAHRVPISVSMILSIALVVCVLTGFLAMARGFEAALQSTGSPFIAVVLGGGTNQETGSEVPPSSIRALEANTGDTGVVRNASGTLVASREIVVNVDVRQDTATAGSMLALRGMDVAGALMRDHVTIAEGRLFSPGTREIVIGRQLAREFGLKVGDTIRLGALDWTITGHFSAQGSVFESEIWADIDAVRSAFDRQGQVQSLRLRLKNPGTLPELQRQLTAIGSTPLVAVTEASLYAAQSGRTASLIRAFGWPLAIMMAIGAATGALNTMMNSVSVRTVEIATLRTLGFSRLSAFIGTWVEAILLTFLGVMCGLILSWLVFNGWQASTIGANNARMVFQLAVTGDVMLTSSLLGLAVGLAGGALPAIAATRIPLTQALRAGR